MTKKDIGITLFVIFLICVSIIPLSCELVKQGRTAPRSCHYEWEDALGNYGTADSCMQTHQGNLICRTADTKRAVINYTYICNANFTSDFLVYPNLYSSLLNKKNYW